MQPQTTTYKLSSLTTVDIIAGMRCPEDAALAWDTSMEIPRER